MPLIRLTYYSENQLTSADGSIVRALNQILSASNRNNKPRNLTGALVFDDLWFLQTLEGERDEVLKTLNRIKTDERHTNIEIAEIVDVESGSSETGGWVFRREILQQNLCSHLFCMPENSILET